MKKFFASLMVMATLAFMVPFEAFAQTYTTRRVYRNGRWQTIRVYTPTNRGNRYGWRNRGVSPQERARLNRQRARIYNSRNRIIRDGVVTRKEARRWNKQTNRYQRTVRRVRNN
jgi:hypothetical protein